MRKAGLVPAITLLALGMFLTLGVVGCIRVTPIEPTAKPVGPSSAAVEVPTRESHDLAVLSIALEPRLDSALASQSSGTILVAVDNKGTETERAVVIEARLGGKGDDDIIATMTETVPALAPGEVKVVRFSGSGNLPARDTYWLEARALPVAGESALANNSKALRIDVVASLRRDLN